jgi:hypothetical protein
MRILNHSLGRRYAPLEKITIVGAEVGTVTVTDALGRAYVRVQAAPEITFTVGGALGNHAIILDNGAEQPPERLIFRVAAKTEIDDAGGRFAELLQMLYYSMVSEVRSDWSDSPYVRYQNRIYRFFVRWLRDHVHVLKGMKYFSPDAQDGIDLYRDSQREDGMIWDNVYPRNGPNYWDVRLAEGDFIRVFDDGSAEFKRIPVEADVEYLFVEGLYYTWKASADDGWMAASLDAAVRAMEYSVTSPYRWSTVFQLIKRGYTIDTWDFQPVDDCVAAGDPMRVDLEKTRFGVMFGDNTGYIAACRYLAEMLDHAGRSAEAARYRERAETIRRRLDELSWNGQYFTHHVPEEIGLKRNLGVDETAQVSLSNAYSLNRGIAHEQSAAIIKTYQRIRDNLPQGSPGEWYTIYPPFQRGFGDHNSVWQYMNSGVTPIVAGELAHGAFEHGAEAYGVDILNRLIDLGRAHGQRFHAVYTGSGIRGQGSGIGDQKADADFIPLDLTTYANIDTNGAGAPGVAGWTGEGDNDLHELPSGRQTFAGVPFLLTDPATNKRRACIGLRTHPGYAQKVTMPINTTATSIYLLHTVSRTKAGGVGGKITLRYADSSQVSEYIVRGQNVSGWWFPEAPTRCGRRTMEVGWRGANAHCPDVGMIVYGLDNPHPERVIEQITLTAAEDDAFWAVCGLTLSDQPAYFPPDPISYGIPDNWAAAAVVYALIEGLAGVVDTGVGYSTISLSPRWVAAGVDTVTATAHYPASDGYVTYAYQHDPTAKQIVLTITGSGEACTCRVLLPPAAVDVTHVDEDGTPQTWQMNVIEQSQYVEFSVELPGPHIVTVRYA